ncbi:hypothetical protein J3T65_08515 [Staphylococcus simiae]|uniref:hypothetical protein n=1 Tax=Staphylococcus simiae TaxID=308354 RepID=UPI001A973F72|nr:hypothetical protein [Staphylococcus simiae]MBO1198459.1 hypothetical protein [Staphylococcus simiae]MBO1201725.1 hypothetical protein [Staphylococcus simiae]MBO1203926.1 hypothetical protein [Staphylococcus simiae]MBO1210450.1 hypothetical protein [Staphylococcus simiae]MBO1230158.1 hypothetical protein [Staphylococcus simiae]
MTIFLIIGVLVPMIYTMRINIKDIKITRKEVINTVLLSAGAILITTVIGVLVTHQQYSLIAVIIGSIITGVVWGLLLVGSYALLRYLSNAFGNKK